MSYDERKKKIDKYHKERDSKLRDKFTSPRAIEFFNTTGPRVRKLIDSADLNLVRPLVSREMRKIGREWKSALVKGEITAAEHQTLHYVYMEVRARAQAYIMIKANEGLSDISWDDIFRIQ